MSKIDSTLNDCATKIQGPFDHLHSARDELLEFVETQLAAIESLHQRLEARSDELDGRERRLEVQEQHVELRQAQNEKSTEHLERQASQLQALKADLEAQSAASGGDEPNQQQLETLQRQSIELAAQLDATQEQARQAEQRAEEARQLLEQAQAELLERRATQAAAAQDDDAGISSEAIDEIAELTAQLGQVREELSRRGEDASDDPNMARRVSDLEQERTALESELELVRGRAAELSETAAAQQRAIAAERAEWADELKQMRKALERQTQTVANAETQVHAQGASGPGYAPRGSGPPPAQAAPPDAVLESIRAQFEQVQRDRARRRDHDAANGSKNVAVL